MEISEERAKEVHCQEIHGQGQVYGPFHEQQMVMMLYPIVDGDQ